MALSSSAAPTALDLHRAVEEAAGVPVPELAQLADRVGGGLADALAAAYLAGVRAGREARDGDGVPERRGDDVTGLRGGDAYEQALGREVARSTRHGHPLALVLIDLGGLERLGGGEADAVLRAVGAVLLDLRRSDETFRVADDRFAVLLPDTDALGAAFVAERLSRRIGETAACADRIAVSAGAAELDGDDPAALHARTAERLPA
jgi:diguanylate cyclase (GGDEF)-like protein